MIEPCNNECAFCFINFTDVLMHNSLFRGLEKREIGAIIRRVHHSVRKIETDTVFAVAGDRLHHLVIIVEGALVGEMMDPAGNILRVEKMAASKAIATAFLFGEHGRVPVTVTATEATKLLLIEKGELLKLFSEDRRVMKNFLDEVSGRAQFLGQRIRMLTLPDLKAKVAFYLVEQMKRTGRNSFRIPDKQQELAEIFASTRPSVGRIFRELHRSGIIHAKGKEVVIKDRKRLIGLLRNRT